MNDLVVQPSSDLSTDIYSQTDEVSWTGPEDMTYEEYERAGRTFERIKQSLSWWMGDWLNYGERKFGEAAMQAVEETGKAVETLMKWKAVSFRLPRELRRADLTWTHHFYVAYVPEEQRGLLLEIAANVGLSSRELKDVVKLDDDLRADFILAVQHYTEEEGPMTREVFFPLLNRFRLGDIEKDEDDDEPEDENGDEDADEVEDTSEEVTYDDLTDFWENAGVPLTYCGKYAVTWEGIAVRAAVDGKGKPYLIWEQTNG